MRISCWSSDVCLSDLAMVRRVVERSSRPLSLSLLQNEQAPERWGRVLDLIEEAVDAGLPIKAQVASRGVGVIMGLELTRPPLVWQPRYQAISHLPLPDLVAALRAADTRRSEKSRDGKGCVSTLKSRGR